MEAATAAARPRRRAGDVIAQAISRYGLIVLLLAMPVAFGISDLRHDGDLTRLATNIKDGISNGAIWALIALGYTLVYGIIELINFAHGDLFMIGSFASYSLFGTLGITLATGTLGVVGGLAVTMVV